MRIWAVMIAGAAIWGVALMRLYWLMQHYCYQCRRLLFLPYPDVIGSPVHKYIGPQYDAAEIEISLEFFVLLLILFASIRWVWRWKSN